MTSTFQADSAVSVNASSERLVARLIDDAARLHVDVTRTDGGTVIVDAGVDAKGSADAGILIARICMGGLGRVARRSAFDDAPLWPSFIEVHTSNPVLACLASQYAGWSLSATKEQTGGKKFFSLGSGPARALACKEPLFDELGYRDRHDRGALVMEVDRLPPQVVIDKVLNDCGLAPDKLVIAVTPTQSVAGTVQVVARVVEVALHKTHVLGVDLAEIVEGSGSAPLPPPAPDGIQAMGRTNDAILYGGRVHLTVKSDAVAKRLAAELPSSNARDYGRPFAEIFTSFNYDFYQIDPALFAPAEAWVSSLESGATYHGGKVDKPLLDAQWSAS
ncbi:MULTISPECIES: methenyltetrahydromethanopterin cyclohydrolase [Caballeronia]|jgi:methenyltetrahydromethanopterin cyclohydrolase|uniref:Methenyltetrahydromethanopterin cyclohydrolase n=1 Tax=Caballeronia zhejiangensis TaxID=871203 RepID=A0A656Q8J1_9BURK|nr:MULTISPECIES: methenyltetrahydromethanopterin cyclohydrolase [Caballeronia]EKS67428.1 N(5),N(10)-methenyltetrahydromethanopterin cyclohydrolase [Burkholderia sp. SJ98]KDR25174.1 N(5),N(10)-methenyltetrahydromethanopterin cyclohydrolase [Caballeronia zhejiangensis]MDR5768200.1 methenyltetrahydromethanopterin cyclohydrolase [Caballeronia sp. LZ028]MDR5789287.1 methenyltetrahydromethanopterin cyclohydrolase [Caballeronia sp. LP003]MDR5796846.1 methenyltetrahydromethanopterin cyclohydrolase [Ca